MTDEFKKEQFLQGFKSTLKSAFKVTDDQGFLLFLHLPHILPGYISYGSDISFFDEIIGMIENQFHGARLILTSDHGYMNFAKGISGYAFDLWNPALNVPFLTSRKINGFAGFNTCHSQLHELIFDGIFSKKDFIFIETAYQLQANRKVAVIYEDYKLIYNKLSNKFEMYDFIFDKDENFNLLGDTIFEWNRGKFYNKFAMYYYPNRDKIQPFYELMREVINNANLKQGLIADNFFRFIWYLKLILRPVKSYFRSYIRTLSKITKHIVNKSIEGK